jgi:preprotein translocase subunit SecF
MTVVTPANAAEDAIQSRLIDIAREAGEHRDERITKSLTQIPPTLMRFVNAMSTALLVLVFVYPFHDRLAGTACFAMMAGALILGNLVMPTSTIRSMECITSAPNHSRG